MSGQPDYANLQGTILLAISQVTDLVQTASSSLTGMDQALNDIREAFPQRYQQGRASIVQVTDEFISSMSVAPSILNTAIEYWENLFLMITQADQGMVESLPRWA